MSYEMIAERLRDVPETALVEIWHYIEFICSKYSVPTDSCKKDTSFIDAMGGLLSHDEAEELKQNRHLKFQEIDV